MIDCRLPYVYLVKFACERLLTWKNSPVPDHLAHGVRDCDDPDSRSLHHNPRFASQGSHEPDHLLVSIPECDMAEIQSGPESQ